MKGEYAECVVKPLQILVVTGIGLRPESSHPLHGQETTEFIRVPSLMRQRSQKDESAIVRVIKILVPASHVNGHGCGERARANASLTIPLIYSAMCGSGQAIRERSAGSSL